MIRIKAEDLFQFSLEALKHVGVKEKDAAIVAENLVLANLRGIDSHGVARLPVYIRRVKEGLIDPSAPIKVVKDQGSVALIDAHNNFGQVAAMKAAFLAAEKAKKLGVGVVAVKNSNHFGMAAHYVMKLTEQKLIGIVLSNGPPAIAPWGGINPMFGTNPICIGFPMGGNEESIILDMAVSVVARGKIRLAALKGERIPEGWALDEEGNPTTDPKAALKGSLVPIGGPKGYGLALSVDILCGLLIGSNFGWKIKELNDFSGPSGTGAFIEAINIEFFRPYHEYKDAILEYVKEIKSCPRKRGISEIFLPGEIEMIEALQRNRLGIPLDDEVLIALKNIAKELQISFLLPKI
ncbi:MAG: Ldh family oxidoreductase [Candidatus Bathyarchaeia archaeon]